MSDAGLLGWPPSLRPERFPSRASAHLAYLNLHWNPYADSCQSFVGNRWTAAHNNLDRSPPQASAHRPARAAVETGRNRQIRLGSYGSLELPIFAIEVACLLSVNWPCNGDDLRSRWLGAKARRRSRGSLVVPAALLAVRETAVRVRQCRRRCS